MADNDSITVVGTVGFDPEYTVDGNGLPRVTLRVASDQWQKNRESGTWEKGDPNWYAIVAFRFLATNIAASVHKGERVIVTGNLKLREWVDGGVKRIKPEIVASSVGHDLNWGTSSYNRPTKSRWHDGEEQPVDSTTQADLPMVDDDVEEPAVDGAEESEAAGSDGTAADGMQESTSGDDALVSAQSDELHPVF